jgi:cell wall-associated NlpC family hydrolase
MPYVGTLSNTLSAIGEIQSNLASLSTVPDSSGFDGVLQQISAISGFAPSGAAAPASAGGTDLSSSYGWPLEEGDPLPGAPTSAGPPLASDSEPGTTGATGPVTAAASGTGVSTQGYQLDTSEIAEAADQADVAGATGGATGGATAAGVQTGTSGTASAAGLGQQAVTTAQKFLGVPYLWGGTNPAQGVDCSGLVQDVYGELGVNLPRTSQEQALVGTAVPSLAEAQPGDLVFFPGSDGTAAAPGHVGIYIGNGQMIDAPYTGTDVQVDPVGDPTAIRRVTGLASSTPTTNAVPSTSTWAGPEVSTAASTSVASQTASTETLPPSASGAASPYDADFAATGAAYSVPPQLLSAVAQTESDYQPGAVSGAGAEGLMQLMPSTAASLGVNPFDPAQAINGAARLLSSYHNTYGSWSLALAAYNAGPGAVDQYSGIPPYAQTQAYVQTVLARAGMDA